jgi:hypothetical protein
MQDFFYVCPGHLKDRQFCTPIIDQAAVEAKKKAALEEEVAMVKKEYEEKQRKKKEKEAAEKKDDTEKEKDKENDKEKDKDAKGDDDKTKDEKSGSPTELKSPEPEEEPREFELKRSVFESLLSSILMIYSIALLTALSECFIKNASTRRETLRLRSATGRECEIPTSSRPSRRDCPDQGLSSLTG